MRRYILMPANAQEARHNELLRSIEASLEGLTRHVDGPLNEQTHEKILGRLELVAALLSEVERRAAKGGEPRELREVEHGLRWLLNDDSPADCRHCEQSNPSLHQFLVDVGQRTGGPKRCPPHEALIALGRLAKLVIGGAP